MAEQVVPWLAIGYCCIAVALSGFFPMFGYVPMQRMYLEYMREYRAMEKPKHDRVLPLFMFILGITGFAFYSHLAIGIALAIAAAYRTLSGA